MNTKRIVPAALILLLSGLALWANGAQESSSETITIEFFQQKREVVDIFDEIIAKFEAENPTIRIEQNHVSDANKVLRSRMAANDVPPLLTHWPNNVNYITAALEGFFVDLTDDPVADGVLPDILESIKLEDGRNYAVPISVNTQGIFYNTALFEKYGLETPRTWNEFISLCRTISNMGETALIFPDKTAWTLAQQFRMSIALDMDGYGLIDRVQAGTADVRDSADMRRVAQKLIDLRRFAQNDPLGTSYEQAIFEFANGSAFMFWQGIWAIPSIEKANPDLQYSMFALPALDGSETRVEYGVDLALAAGESDADDIAAAKKFIAFVATPEIGQFYADRDGSPSALKGVEFNSEISRPLVEYVQAGNAFRNIRYKYAPGGNARINTAMQQLLMDGDIDAFLGEVNYVFGKPE